MKSIFILFNERLVIKYEKKDTLCGAIFYDIYTEEEKAADSAKEDTGLFF